MRYASCNAEVYGVNMGNTLDDKVTVLACATISGAGCVAGGFMLGWAKANDIYLQYEDLCKYGPTLFTAGAMAAYNGLDTYSEAKKQNLAVKHALPITVMSAIGVATMGGFFAAYNTLFFFALGYLAGKISK